MLSSVVPPVVEVDGSSVLERLLGVVVSAGAAVDGLVLGLGDAVLGEPIVPVLGDVVLPVLGDVVLPVPGDVVLVSALGGAAVVLGVVALGLVVDGLPGVVDVVDDAPLSVDVEGDVDCAYT